MGRPDQDRKLAKVKDFMALVGSHAQAARSEHANASSRMHGASKHVYMDKHTVYTVEPHGNSLLYTDGFAIMRPGFPDAVQHRPNANTRWLYGDNHKNNQANGSLAFAAARHPDWSNAGAGRQPYLSFSGSQEQISVQKVNNYQATQARANENAMVGCISTDLNCDVPANFLQNHPRGPKVFPFLAPVLQHEHTSAVRLHETPTPLGRAANPRRPITKVSSSRIMPPDSSIRPSTTQLTIFYAGQINVYNDVSPTQARDIILKASACDHLQTDKGNKLDSLTAAACDHLLQPLNKGTLDTEKFIPSVISNEPGVHAALPDLLRLDLSTGKSGQSARDPIDMDHSPASVQEAPQTVESFTVGAQSAYHDYEPAVPKALPQARKASLSRFFEKRRERMLSKAPYLVEKSFL